MGKKRVLSLLLALCLALALVPATALAADSDFTIVDGVLRKYTGLGGDVVIPDGVKVIDQWVFSNFDSITSVTIPDGVTQIGWSAFAGCANLAKVTIPGSVKEIGARVFAGCSRLNIVIIPEGVTLLGGQMFSGCNDLSCVVVPQSVTAIGDGAFHSLVGGLVNENFSLRGVAGSYAETYAKENGIPFVAALAPGQPSSGAGDQQFADVAPDAWYYEAVNNMAYGGLLLGYDDGLFHPDDEITVGQFAMILARVTGLDTTPKEGAHWATGALDSIAKKLVYIRDDDQADELVNRGEAITSMVNLAEYMMKYATTDKTKAAGPSAEAMGFKINDVWPYLKQVTEKVWTFDDLPDKDLVLAKSPYRHWWNARSILLAYNLGIVEGVDDSGTCAPDRILTRAQVCQLLYRMGISSEGAVTISGIFGFG